jgi:hypothetical protein
MTEQEHKPPIEEPEHLFPRQVDRLEWLVLSTRNDNTTVHQVDLGDLSCTCKDKAFNRETREPCDHIAQALLTMDVAIDPSEYASAHLTALVDRAHRAVGEIEDMKDGNPQPTTESPSEATETANSGSSSPDVEVPSQADVDLVNTWLSRNFAQPEKVEVELAAHAGQEGVKLSPDNQNMQDHIYESFKNLVNSVDGSGVHVGFGDDPCHECGQQDGEFWYHLNRSGLQEVLDHHG